MPKTFHISFSGLSTVAKGHLGYSIVVRINFTGVTLSKVSFKSPGKGMRLKTCKIRKKNKPLNT